jgi:hypothetical protein
MAFLRRMEKYYMIIILLFLVVFVSLFYLPRLRSNVRLKESFGEKLGLLNFASNSDLYSSWPKFIDITEYSTKWLNVFDNKEDYFKKLKCFNANKSLEFKISNFHEIISLWRLSKDEECVSLYKSFVRIYDIKIKNSNVNIPNTFVSKVKSWLGNNDKLFQQVKSQVCIFEIDKMIS